MVDVAPDISGIQVAIDSEAQNPFLLFHLRSIPWLQITRTLKECFTSIENIVIFNSSQDTGLPMYLVPTSLQAYSEYENGLLVKELLNTAADTTMVQDFDVFHYMSTTIYLLSNRLVVMEGEALLCLLETLRDRIPRSILMKILTTPLPAMRAAWEVLIRSETTSSFDSLFNLLVDAGIQNEWLNVESMGHDYLYYAVRAKCFDAMKKLLIHGCRADSGWLHEKDSAIISAIQGGHLVEANLLMRYCDVNRNFILYRNPSTAGQSNNFAMFMYQYNKDDPSHRRGLRLFFEHGAKFDAPWFDSPFEPRRNPAMLEFYKLNNISLKWWPTMLDYYFYADRSTYRKLRRYSKGDQHASSATPNRRSDILLALEQDNISRLKYLLSYLDEEIEEYLQKNPAASQAFPHWSPRPSHISLCQHDWERHPFLELLFIEQFLLGGVWYKDMIQQESIWELIELGVDLNIPSLPNTDMTELLCVALTLIPTTGSPRRQMERIFYEFCSLHRDSVNWPKVFQEVAKTNNTEVFRFFEGKALNASQNGEDALLESARLENYQAIHWLLSLGVNIQSLAAAEDHPASTNGNCTSRQSRSLKPHPKVALSAQMTDFLSRKGLHLEPISEPIVDIFDPLLEIKSLLRKGSANLLQRLKYLMHKMRSLSDQEPESLSSYLLELCLRGLNPWKERQQRLEAFEFCFRQGAKLSPGSPLSVLIYAGGRTELIQELLDMGAEVNAFSHDMDAEFPKLSEPWSLTPLQAAASCGNEEVVNKLLERGADVNAPALNRLGKTALQSICGWIPGAPEERDRKTRIVNLLLERGADVNATPADWCGRTALQIAAKAGELELVVLLLHHGADVNAPTCQKQGWVALDGAAFEGRLDVVKLLLDSGARSLYHGSTGYDGAIDLAKHRGHFATADLIGTHTKGDALSTEQ